MSVTSRIGELVDATSVAIGITDASAIPVRCDWVNSMRSSGAMDAFDNILGNVIGVVQANWVYILIIAALIAGVTFVLGRQHNSRWIKVTMWAAIIAVVLTPAINFFSRLAPGVC